MNYVVTTNNNKYFQIKPSTSYTKVNEIYLYMYYFIKHYGMFYNLNILLHKFFNLYQINLTLSYQIKQKQTYFVFKDNLLNLNLNVNKYLITPTNLKLSNINSFVKNKKLNIQIKYPFI